jgi:hypothetical protein
MSKRRSASTGAACRTLQISAAFEANDVMVDGKEETEY